MDSDFICCTKPNLRPEGTRRKVDVRTGKTIRFIEDHSKALRRYKNGFIVKYKADDSSTYEMDKSPYWNYLEVADKEDLVARDPTRDGASEGVYLSIGKKKRWEYVDILEDSRESLVHVNVGVVTVPVVNSGSHLNTHRDRANIQSRLIRSRKTRKFEKAKALTSKSKKMHPRLVKGRKGLMIRKPRQSYKRQKSETDKLVDMNRAYKEVYIVEKPLQLGVFPAFIGLKDARKQRIPRKERQVLRPNQV
jgi:hypothetical protein